MIVVVEDPTQDQEAGPALDQSLGLVAVEGIVPEKGLETILVIETGIGATPEIIEIDGTATIVETGIEETEIGIVAAVVVIDATEEAAEAHQTNQPANVPLLMNENFENSIATHALCLHTI